MPITPATALFLAPRPPHTVRGQAGLTVVEVLVAIVLTSLLMLGMHALWQASFRQLDELTLRQKAVFRVSAEMERLAAGYWTDGLIASGTVEAEDSGQYDTIAAALDTSFSFLGTPADRLVWPDSSVTSLSAATLTAADDADRILRYGEILHYLDGGQPRNLVWLDFDRNLLARLSWTLGGTFDDCANCQELTLFLDYPFRFGSTTDPLRAVEGYPLETVTLKTIVRVP